MSRNVFFFSNKLRRSRPMFSHSLGHCNKIRERFKKATLSLEYELNTFPRRGILLEQEHPRLVLRESRKLKIESLNQLLRNKNLMRCFYEIIFKIAWCTISIWYQLRAYDDRIYNRAFKYITVSFFTVSHDIAYSCMVN